MLCFATCMDMHGFTLVYLNFREKACKCLRLLHFFHTRKHRYLPHGSHFALEMATRACPGAAGALGRAVRACFGAASALKKAAKACSGGANALGMVALAGSASTSALKKTVRARFGAASAFKAAVPAGCSRSLFENAGLGYTLL